MTYYRYTNTDSPMSDWGHAMFVDNSTDSDHYGNIAWEVEEASDAFDMTVESNRTEIAEKLIEAIEDGNISGFDYLAEQCSVEEVADSFNPDDIVNGAGFYDSELIEWIYEAVGGKDIITYDGYIGFNESIIKRNN